MNAHQRRTRRRIGDRRMHAFAAALGTTYTPTPPGTPMCPGCEEPLALCQEWGGCSNAEPSDDGECAF